MPLHRSRLLPAALLLAITSTLTAQDALPPGVSRVASVEGITEYRLANGLRAVMLPDRGAQRNATTSFDRTNYYEVFPASDENLDWALDLEADGMFNAAITRELLTSQMSVVRNEFEIGENDSEYVLYQRVFSTAFLWHNYGKSTIGARTDIERVPIERLQAFYRTYYRPDNAVLIVAGRFDERRAVDRLNRAA